MSNFGFDGFNIGDISLLREVGVFLFTYIKLMISKFIFKCLNKTNPVNFHNWYILTSQLHMHNTRSNFFDIANCVPTRTLFIPIARTAHYGLKLIKIIIIIIIIIISIIIICHSWIYAISTTSIRVENG